MGATNVAQILTNFRQFLDILNSACGRRVEDWDTSRLSKAYEWAQYCEQLSEKLLGNVSVASKIDEKISLIGQLPGLLLGYRRFTLQHFSRSTAILEEMLLLNPYTDDNLLHQLIDRHRHTDSNTQFIQDLSVWGTSKAKMNLLSTIEKCLSGALSDLQQEPVTSSSDVISQMKAQFLQRHLLIHVVSGPATDKGRQHTCRLLHMFLAHSTGLYVIVLSLLKPVTVSDGGAGVSGGEDHVVYVEFVLKWLMDCGPVDSGGVACIWNLPLPLLRRLSTEGHMFRGHYLNFLTEWAGAMVTRHHPQTQQNDWRHRTVAELSWQRLCEHFSMLLSVEDEVSTVTMQHITQQQQQQQQQHRQSTELCVWDELLYSVKHN